MTATLGLGIAGAGRFAAFLADAVADLPGLALRAVADSDRSRADTLAAAHGVRAAGDWRALLDDDEIDVVAVTTPPYLHGEMTLAALAAGRHVLCEKPLATDLGAARDVAAAAGASGQVLVVDHVLRYNPVLQALVRLQDELLGPVQRFSFDNDASDENLPPEHWFWDEQRSGGIFVEHGVHFFDAAHLLLGTSPERVSALAARRADGTIDSVSATALHPGGVIATHTHAFTHADRCERQTLRLDHGAAGVQVEGWIPLRARVDAWTDDAGAETAYGLPARAAELFDVPGHRLGPGSGVTAVVHRDAGPPAARGRGRELHLPHRVVLELVLGDDGAKARVYAESVRAAAADLVAAAAGGQAPRSGAARAGRRHRRRRGPPGSRRGQARATRPGPHRWVVTRRHEDRMTQTRQTPGPRAVERVDKPWGHEEIFAVVEGSYVGKLVTVEAGGSLSLRYHEEKDETIALVSGRAELDLGTAADALRVVALVAGTSVHIPAGVLHRLRALDTSVLVEASTAAPGWREDVVRLHDHYGRSGTSAP